MIKKIILNIITFAIILLAFNWIYKRFFYEKDLQQHSEVINLVREVPLDADIVYIGESSNVTSRSDDNDKRKISEFIGDYYPELKLSDITKPASHAGIYKVLLEKIPKKSSAQTVIVTLNLRSFNAQWIYSELETPLQKSIVLLKDYPPIINRFFLSFKNYDIKSKKERERQFKRQWKKDKFELPFNFKYRNTREWDRAIGKQGIKDKNGNKDYKKTELACHFIKGYAFQIDTLTNPRIKDFNDIIQLAKQRNWNLVFNLMAENIEKAQELVGEDLIYFIDENRKLLVKYFEAKGVTVIDNLDAVEDEQFIDQNWTTEHYAEKGRRIIAKNVAQKLQKFYSKDYKNVEYNFYPTNSAIKFFYNCDDTTTVWGQQQTITNEKAFSGEFSSKVNKENPYSITFEHLLKQIPDNKKNTIHIQCKTFQTFIDNQSKLVIEFEKTDGSNSWHGFELNNQIKTTNEWIQLRYNFQIPNESKDVKKVKIYVFNPTSHSVFVDDFAIEFN